MRSRRPDAPPCPGAGARLQRYNGDLKLLAVLWTLAFLVTLGVAVAGLVVQIVHPYVVVLLGGAALVSVLWRIERVWRERTLRPQCPDVACEQVRAEVAQAVEK
jgi:Flp pilus assembly protein TadB